MNQRAFKVKLAALREALKARWQVLKPRERRLVSVAAVVVLGALLWQIGIRPAWQMHESYPGARNAVDLQLQQMYAMRQQALQQQQLLQSTAGAVENPQTLSKELQSSAERLLGASAQVALVGDRVTVRFQDVAAAALAQWLSQTREATRSQPAQLQLQRGATGAGGAPAWSGEVALVLPAAPTE